jgi:photosystem II stability/assembly factor-like uncharacterized protein
MRSVFITAFGILCPLLLSAQTAEELLAKNLQARGGAEKLKAIKTLRMSGRVQQGSFTAQFSQIAIAPNLMRQALTVQGMSLIQSYDGSTGWQINPFQGRKDAELMGEDDLRELTEEADFYGPLVEYKTKDNRIEYLGHDTVDGDDAYRVKVTLANGDILYYYFDPDTYLEIRTEKLQFIRSSVRETFVNLGSYKLVDGVYFPFSMEQGRQAESRRRHQSDSRQNRSERAGERGGFQNAKEGWLTMTISNGRVCFSLPAAVLAIPLAASFLLAQTPVRFDSGTISGLPARNIGSAQMSGRIAAIAAVNDGGSLTLFAGSASGGVWKSVNGGTSFKPVFNSQAVQSIGSVAIDARNHKIVWVGTGESWVRNSVSIGDGIYKSVDGGENWTNMGLRDSEHIAKILVDPADSDTVYACVTGHLWNDSAERGVYKTSDGGKNWRKVLGGANGSTGCAMLATSAQNPKTLYASLWDFRRQAWTFRSGGPGSGLYQSTDGGEHWTEFTAANAKGLPEKPYGRIAVAVAPSKPQVIYAMIESKSSALFRSDDAGKNWTRLDASQYMVWRPFYFANLIVDPKDENKVFKVDLLLLLSVNGGKSFSPVSGSAHGDFHDVWIDAGNPNSIFACDDGGLWRSQDGGTRWAHLMNLPVSQFYHVSVDTAEPYHVYGGLQDNSSWVGDSSYPGGVSNSRWENMFGGDGFWTWEDPSDSNYIYAEAQGGQLAVSTG